MRTSLVVQTSFLGDVILTTPLVARLAEDGDVDMVTTPAGAAALANNPAIRRVIVYDKRRGGPGAFVDAALAARRSGRGRRAAYLAQGSLRSAALSMAAGYRERIGFATSGGRALYTRQVAYRDDWHHVQRLLALADAQAASIDAAILRPRLYPGGDDVAAVDALLAGRTRPLVAVAPGSVWATKRWPGYGALSRLLSADFDVAVVGGAGDLAITREVGPLIDPERLVDATGKLSILGSAELLRRAMVVVTNDSAPQHLASAVGTPTVALFGPTVPAFGFGPLAPGSRAIGCDGLPCRPCDRHGPRQCPLGHWRCMRDVSVERVHKEILDVMQGRGSYGGDANRQRSMAQ